MLVTKFHRSFLLSVILVGIVVNCGSLMVMNPGPGNLVLDQSDGTYFTNVTTYSCDEGYNVIGDRTRTCQADETWSGTEPVCERKSEFYEKLEQLSFMRKVKTL